MTAYGDKAMAIDNIFRRPNGKRPPKRGKVRETPGSTWVDLVVVSDRRVNEH